MALGCGLKDKHLAVSCDGRLSYAAARSRGCWIAAQLAKPALDELGPVSFGSREISITTDRPDERLTFVAAHKCPLPVPD